MANNTREYYEVVLGDMRVIHPHVCQPTQAPIKGQPGKKAAPRYKVDFLVPKSDTETLKKLTSVLGQDFKQSFADGTKEQFAAAVANCRKDGDRPDAKPYEAGNWVFSANSDADHKPAVFGTNQQPLLDASQIYGGCYCHLQLLAGSGTNPSSGQPYVKLYIVQVMKSKDGEKLGGAGPNPNAFASVIGNTQSDVSPFDEVPF